MAMRRKLIIAVLAAVAVILFAQPETLAATGVVVDHVLDTYMIAYVTQVASVLGCF